MTSGWPLTWPQSDTHDLRQASRDLRGLLMTSGWLILWPQTSLSRCQASCSCDIWWASHVFRGPLMISESLSWPQAACSHDFRLASHDLRLAAHMTSDGYSEEVSSAQKLALGSQSFKWQCPLHKHMWHTQLLELTINFISNIVCWESIFTKTNKPPLYQRLVAYLLVIEFQRHVYWSGYLPIAS